MATTMYPYYTIWTGALNLGDTPGVFTDASFVGLQLQLPFSITSGPAGDASLKILLRTTNVEVFGGNRHPIYWDWNAGAALPTPVGYIDDADPIPGKPEFHLATIPKASASVGRHWLTIIVNSDIPAGMRDDFVLQRIEAHDSFGVKLGW